MKHCKSCNEDKPFSEFHKNSSKPDGLATVCKSCNNEYKKGWRKANPEKNKKSKHYTPSLKTMAKIAIKSRLKRYDLSPCQFAALRINSGDRCEICSSTDRTVIDHDHETGKVRGILCHNCNTGLGQFRDSVERLESAISYLKR